MNALALLLACGWAVAADVEGVRDNFDTVVRNFAAGKSEDGVWTLEQKGAKKPLRLRYDKVEPDSLREVGEGKWVGLADFVSTDGKKRYYAAVGADLGDGAWEVALFQWLTAKQAAEFRKTPQAAPPPREEGGAERILDPDEPREPRVRLPREYAGKDEPVAPLLELLARNHAGFYESARKMDADLLAALKVARRAKKRVLLTVGEKSCSWCFKLRDYFEADAELKEMREKRFVTVYAEARANFERIYNDYGSVPGTPHWFVLDDTGALVHSQDTELLEKGKTYDREKMVAFLVDYGP